MTEKEKGFEIRCKTCGCSDISIHESRQFDDVDPDVIIKCNHCGNKEKRT